MAEAEKTTSVEELQKELRELRECVVADQTARKEFQGELRKHVKEIQDYISGLFWKGMLFFGLAVAAFFLWKEFRNTPIVVEKEPLEKVSKPAKTQFDQEALKWSFGNGAYGSQSGDKPIKPSNPFNSENRFK